MSRLFLKIVNMSISASWLVLAVLVLRFVLKKAPKWVNILLWGMVAVRLICPFSIESSLSLIPSAETVSPDIMMSRTPTVQSGVPAINGMLNPVIQEMFTPAAGASANPLQILVPVFSGIWVLGIAVLLVYTAVSCYFLRRRVKTAVRYRDNIFCSEHVSSPFVLGVVRPRIYLPFQMDGEAFQHVVAHEQAHIRRKDHWWKPLGFLLLTVYWFNPLMWLGYVLLSRDIELACDEKVIKALDPEKRAEYAQMLVGCSIRGYRIAACPLAFGEVGVKERVKSVMKYQKATFWIFAVSILVCAVTAICFLTNPDSVTIQVVVPAGSQEGFTYSWEEISPTRNAILVTSGDNLGDTEIILEPTETRQENAYDESFYLTPGMPVKIEAEKGAWFKIGVSVQNPTQQDMVVSVNVKHAQIRAPKKTGVFLGDAPKVVEIAQNLPYPEGCAYSSIELQTNTEPYELTVYLNGPGTMEALMNCADAAFQKIENVGILSFRSADTGETMASYIRPRYLDVKFYLTIGAEDVTYIELAMPDASSGCQNANGTPFKKGEQIYLEPLRGYTSVCGLKITARNQAGEAVWTGSIPEELPFTVLPKEPPVGLHWTLSEPDQADWKISSVYSSYPSAE